MLLLIDRPVSHADAHPGRHHQKVRKSSYAKGTKICSKFWVYTGATGSGAVNGYQSLGTACAKIG